MRPKITQKAQNTMGYRFHLQMVYSEHCRAHAGGRQCSSSANTPGPGFQCGSNLTCKLPNCSCTCVPNFMFLRVLVTEKTALGFSVWSARLPSIES